MGEFLSLLENNAFAIGVKFGSVQFWDIGTATLIRSVQIEFSHFYKSIIVSRDGRWIVSSTSYGDRVSIWAATNGKFCGDLDYGQGVIKSIAVSSDGRAIAVHLWEKVQLWETETRTLQHSWECKVEKLLFSPDGQILACHNRGGTISLWNTFTGTLHYSLKGRQDAIYSIAFSTSGNIVASGSLNGKIQLWNFTNGALVAAINDKFASAIAIAVSPDDQTIASGTRSGCIKLFSAIQKPPGRDSPCDEENKKSVSSIAVSPDGAIAALAYGDSTVKLWDVSRNLLVQTLKGHRSPAACLKFSPDGSTLFTRSSDGTIRIWDTTSGLLIRVLTIPVTPGVYSFRSFRQTMAVSPDGQTIVSYDGEVHAWSATTGEYLAKLDEKLSKCKFLGFSPNGHIALASPVADQETSYKVYYWLHRISEDRGSWVTFSTASFSLGGKFLGLIKTSAGNVDLWNTSTGELRVFYLSQYGWRGVEVIALSQSGMFIATASQDGRIELWETSTGALLEVVGSDTSALELKFASDDSYLISNRGILRSEKLQSQNSAFGSERSDAIEVLVTDTWITCNQERAVWLPPQYRTKHVQVHGFRVALGLESGEVAMLDFAGWAAHGKRKAVLAKDPRA